MPPIVGDLDLDYNVNEIDLEQLTASWLQTDAEKNLAGDETIDLSDFTAQAANWKQFNPAYYP